MSRLEVVLHLGIGPEGVVCVLLDASVVGLLVDLVHVLLTMSTCTVLAQSGACSIRVIIVDCVVLIWLLVVYEVVLALGGLWSSSWTNEKRASL